MGYGAIGNASFRYYRDDIAEGITLTGQLALRYMSRVIDNFLNEVCGTKNVSYAIYGDTDSNFIKLDNWVKLKYCNGLSIVCTAFVTVLVTSKR